MSSSVQFLGLCRFSLPSLGGFQSQPGDIDEVRARLYDPHRLDTRLAWFEHVALPAIRAQQDKDFTLVLLIGEDLPQPWRGALEALVREVPQIVLTEAAPGPHREICAAAMRPHVRADAEALAQFRLDDDDAISVNFILRARRDLAVSLGVLDLRRQFAVDYGCGLVLTWGAEGLTAEARFAREWTPGLLHVSRPDLGRFILDMDHSRMWWHMPVLSWTDEVMWVRGAHGDNDSSIGAAGRNRIEVKEDTLAELLRRRFQIRPAEFALRLMDISPDNA